MCYGSPVMSNILMRLVISLQMILHPVICYTAYAQTPPPAQSIPEHFSKAEQFNRQVESLRQFLLGENPKASTFFTHNELDTFALLGQGVGKEIKEARSPFFEAKELQQSWLDKGKLFFEIVKNGTTKALLNSRGEIVGKLLDQPMLELYAGTNFITDSPTNRNEPVSSKNLYSFRIGYRKHLLHSFPQHIKWMALVDNFAVFFEPSRMSNEKAFLSFIDLRYFGPAIGKTALPIFQVPITLNEEMSSELIATPRELRSNIYGLEIVGEKNTLKITHEQLSLLSRLQQLMFNFTVSMVDVTDYEQKQEFVLDMARVYTEHLETTNRNTLKSINPQIQKSYQGLKNFVQENMLLRAQLGSFKDATGPFGVLNSSRDKLVKNLTPETPQESRKVVDDFARYLEQDLTFQNAIHASSEQLARDTKLWNRAKVFFSHMTRPQPLGAPHVKKALGMIANSLRKGETFEQRMAFFHEGVARYLSNKSTRVSAAVLAGLAIGTTAFVSGHFQESLFMVGRWLGDWGQLASVTFDSGFVWLTNINKVYDSYIANGNAARLAVGMGSLFGIMAAWLGTLQFGVNLMEFAGHLRRQDEIEHRGKMRNAVSKVWGTLKRVNRKNFIDYVEKGRKDFWRDLAFGEMRKIGLNMTLVTPDGTESRGLFRTTEHWKNLIRAFQSEEDISLEIESKDTAGNHVPERLHLLGTEMESTSQAQAFEIRLHPTQEQSISRKFALIEGNIASIHKDGKIKEQKGEGSQVVNLSIEASFSNSEINVKGFLEDANFAPEEERKLEKVLKEIQGTNEILETLNGVDRQSIQSLRGAIWHLATGYSSWARTFRVLGLAWNWFFLSRNVIFFPLTMGMPLMYYSKFFTRLYKDKHRATTFNGGKDSRLRDIKTLVLTSKVSGTQSLSQSLEQLKSFEEHVISIEKNYLRASTEMAFLEIVKNSAEMDSFHRSIRKGVTNSGQHLRGRDRIFFEMFQRKLFAEGMREYFLEKVVNVNPQARESTIRRALLKRLKESNGQLDWMENESLTDIRQRLTSLAKDKNLLKFTIKEAKSFFNGKKSKIKWDIKQEQRLNPDSSLFIDRFQISEKMLNDPESLSRATRQMIIKLLYDKPIEIAFTFLFLAAVTEGILRPLHDTAFSEDSWFYLSRYVLWNGFFMGIMLQTFAGVWMKVQMDSRLDKKGGFDIIPEKADIDKRAAYLRWYWKQFRAKDNGIMANWAHDLKIIWANLGAALITISSMNFATLGRFDFDVYLNIYLFAFLFPFGALGLKMENAFEKSANFSLKELIKRGIDFNGENRKLLGHPKVQAYKIKMSSKLRRNYNLWLSVMYDNPINNLISIFENINVQGIGTRAFQRLLLGGNLATEYYVGFMDFLEGKGVPSKVTEACKLLLVRNRTDLNIE